MSGPDDGKDVALDGLIGEALAGLEHRIAAVPRAPDFLDVVGRANEIDAGAVPKAMVVEAAVLAPVVDIRTGGRDVPAVERELDGFIAEVKQAVDAKVGNRRMAPIPPLPATPPPKRLRTFVLATGGLLAAALVGWLTVGGAERWTPVEVGHAPQQAVYLGVGADTSGGPTIERHERPTHERSTHEDVAVSTEQLDADLPETPVPAPVPEPGPAKRSKADRDSRSSQLLEQAQRQWRSGDLDGARTTLKKVVKIGGRSQYAQSAFADLFAIAHQAGKTSGRENLWSSYLRRFPRGRYADDARAGLCRSASQSKRAPCWTKYLREFPRGSYRAEASRTVGSP